MAQRMQWSTFSGTGPELYQRFMVEAIVRPWAEEFVALAELRAGVRVLDVACGTGAVTRIVAERVGGPGRVVGLDLSPGMLAVARASSGPGIEWREGNAMAMPFPDGAFDRVLCHQGLQFMPDRPAALREMRRVLAADGLVVLGVFCSSPGNVALAHALAPHLGPQAADMVCEPFAFSDREALRSLVVDAGFRDVMITLAARTARFPSPDDFIGYLLASRLAGAVAQVSDDDRAVLVDSARAALSPYEDGDGLALPMESRLVVAHRETNPHQPLTVEEGFQHPGMLGV
jgi:ubiquinone/menaquinone biosynthesis C-methylase UbiE